MIIQPTATVAFQSTELDTYDINGTRWLRGVQIVTPLGITSAALKMLYKRHRKEFSREMTDIITVPSPGGAQQTRVFSPRGVALICMLVNSPKAAIFREWALDVLEGKAAPLQAPQTVIPAHIPPPVHPFADPRDAQIRALQAQLIKTNPRWQKLERYCRAGLSNVEIGKLLGVSRWTAGVYLRDMRKAGLLPSGKQLELFHG
jgi:DNA-binding CsgD family transcriptional regulator